MYDIGCVGGQVARQVIRAPLRVFLDRDRTHVVGARVDPLCRNPSVEKQHPCDVEVGAAGGVQLALGRPHTVHSFERDQQ